MVILLSANGIPIRRIITLELEEFKGENEEHWGPRLTCAQRFVQLMIQPSTRFIYGVQYRRPWRYYTTSS